MCAGVFGSDSVAYGDDEGGRPRGVFASATSSLTTKNHEHHFYVRYQLQLLSLLSGAGSVVLTDFSTVVGAALSAVICRCFPLLSFTILLCPQFGRSLSQSVAALCYGRTHLTTHRHRQNSSSIASGQSFGRQAQAAEAAVDCSKIDGHCVSNRISSVLCNGPHLPRH